MIHGGVSKNYYMIRGEVLKSYYMIRGEVLNSPTLFISVFSQLLFLRVS